MIHVGIDDTDMPGALGADQATSALAAHWSDRCRRVLIVRHPRLQDRRVPRASRNCSSSTLEARCHRSSTDHFTKVAAGKARLGFTLLELLVVIAIIGSLLALLLPAVQASRGVARRVMCASHLKQLSVAAHGYHECRGEFPPGLDQFEAKWSPRFRGTSLFTFLLPYIEQGNVLAEWNYDLPLANTQGGPHARSATVLQVLLCPSDRLDANRVAVAGRYFGMTSYGGNGGTRSYHPTEATCDGMFHTTGPASDPIPNQRSVSLSRVSDGASQTILLGERSHTDPHLETFVRAHWAESLKYLGRWAAIGGRKRIGDVAMSAFAPINYRIPFGYGELRQRAPQLTSMLDFEIYEDRRKCAFGSGHPHGANFAFVDGSVRFLDDSLPWDTLRSLCSRNGHEVISGSDRIGAN